MRDSLKRSAGWLTAGWFWTAVLLVLPACGLQSGGTGPAPTQNLDQGSQPWSSMIMCEIEKMNGRHCPTSQAEIDGGIKFSEAAIALAEGRWSTYGVDDSETGRKNCGGDPEIVEFEGDVYPHGVAVCLNCSQVPSMAEAIKVCRQRCYDFHGTTEEGWLFPDIPPTAETQTFCDSTARVATNGVITSGGDMCYANLCTADGNTTGVPDPREVPEPVIWTLLSGTAAGGTDGNDLTRTALATGAWDAGAVSQQWITRGNAYVEFSVQDNTQSHFVGLTPIPGCASPCSTDTPDDNSIGFALQLYNDGYYYIVESGVGQHGPNPNYSWGTYTSADRFRIYVTVDDVDETKAHIKYSRVVGTCLTGQECNIETIFENTVTLPSYPFRVDTSLKEEGATLTNVRLVRIQF